MFIQFGVKRCYLPVWRLLETMSLYCLLQIEAHGFLVIFFLYKKNISLKLININIIKFKKIVIKFNYHLLN